MDGVSSRHREYVPILCIILWIVYACTHVRMCVQVAMCVCPRLSDALQFSGGRVIPHEGPDEDDITITLETVFAFATGSDHEPPLGFENTPEIHFEMRTDRFLPYASTCGPTLYLPIALVDPDSFREKMDYAITCAHGFGNP